MSLGAEGVVQFFHGVDGVVHRVQLAQQAPGRHSLADVHHRAPDNHRRRNADKQPHHARAEVVLRRDYHQRHHAQNQQNLQTIDDDGVVRRFPDRNILLKPLQTLHLHPSRIS